MSRGSSHRKLAIPWSYSEMLIRARDEPDLWIKNIAKVREYGRGEAMY